MKYIDLAEAKKQMQTISSYLDEPLLLIGGIAVNQYDVTRQSQDIDLICSHETATNLVRDLYPSDIWRRRDVKNDEYRPSYYLEHKHDNKYPVIKFGPKIKERGAYKYLDWEQLKKDAVPFKYKNETFDKILVPSMEALCYTKIVSFLGRNKSQKEKLRQDIRDITELTNIDSFQIGVFLNYIFSNRMEEELVSNLHSRISHIDESLEGSNIGKLIKLFSKQNVVNEPIEAKNCVPMMQPQPQIIDTQNITRLVAFDLDGTLIKGIRHSWTVVWRHLNVDSKGQLQRKEKFRKKQLSYLDWCRLDGEDFKKNGLNKAHFQEIIKSHGLALTKNLREGLKALRDKGIKTAVISGGIDALLYELLPDADELFDEILINRFVFSDIGDLKSISATEYDWDDSKIGVVGKRRGLERVCEKYNISMEDSAFVGDDLNDIEAMKSAGLKIFYCGDTREFVNGNHLPQDIAIIPENDFLKIVERVLNPPIGEQVD